MTPEQTVQMIKNGHRPDADHVPVVKLFHTFGAATWLLTEIDPDEPDIAFGLCDLGQGCPELGYVSISEIESIKMLHGRVPAIERDEHFEGKHPISVYTAAARYKNRIVEDESVLRRFAKKDDTGPAFLPFPPSLN